MAGSLGNNGGRLYSFGAQPVLIDCNFIVDSTNGNGRGIRSLKGQGVQQVFMHTSAAFTGTSHTSTLIDGISGGTASLVVGMPVQGSGIAAGTTIASIVDSGSIRLSAATSSSTTGSITYQAVGSPNPAAGLAWVQLSANYNRYLGGFSGFASPTTGSLINIDATDAALTVGQPYIIASVGHAAAGTFTIAPVADSSGSLASAYFVAYDAYGNTWVVWFSVSGVGARPNLGPAAPDGVAGLHYVQQSILTNATAAQIGAALVLTLENLPSGIASVSSFTASGSSTVTVVNTSTSPYHLPGVPADGVLPTGFAFALTVDDHNLADWQGVGLPKGLFPTVGQSFVAKATGSGKSTGQVIAVGVSSIVNTEVIGDPNLSLAPSAQGGSPNVGGWILVQFVAPTISGSAFDTPFIPKAPTNGSVAGMSFYVDARQSPSNISNH